MDIYVLRRRTYDGKCDIADVLENFESAIWTVQMFGKSECQVRVRGSQENIRLLTKGNLLVRDCDMSNENGAKRMDNVMLIVKNELSFDTEKGWTLTVTGYGFKSVLRQRAILSQSTLNGNVEEAIRKMVDENAIHPTNISREIRGLSLAETKGFTETLDTQGDGENMADWIENVCQTYGIGWDVYLRDGYPMFTLWKGTDRTYGQTDVTPVVFSESFDNLLTCTYTESWEEVINAGVVGGEGEGADRVTASFGDDEHAVDLWRYETYIDGSSVQSNEKLITSEEYLPMLRQYADEQMKEKTNNAKKFEGTIDPNGMYVLNKDFFLGDKVQVDLQGIKASAMITEIIYSEDENGTSVVPTFNEWEVS